jgi:hypothetical protein
MRARLQLLRILYVSGFVIIIITFWFLGREGRDDRSDEKTISSSCLFSTRHVNISKNASERIDHKLTREKGLFVGSMVELFRSAVQNLIARMEMVKIKQVLLHRIWKRSTVNIWRQPAWVMIRQDTYVLGGWKISDETGRQTINGNGAINM